MFPIAVTARQCRRSTRTPQSIERLESVCSGLLPDCGTRPPAGLPVLYCTRSSFVDPEDKRTLALTDRILEVPKEVANPFTEISCHRPTDGLPPCSTKRRALRKALLDAFIIAEFAHPCDLTDTALQVGSAWTTFVKRFRGLVLHYIPVLTRASEGTSKHIKSTSETRIQEKEREPR